MITRGKLQYPYFKKVLDLLKPWSVCLDLYSDSQIDSLERGQINNILLVLPQTERNIGISHKHGNKLSEAESYCLRALSYAR
jgi:hypothetical protein